jgi:hypothetical protein
MTPHAPCPLLHPHEVVDTDARLRTHGEVLGERFGFRVDVKPQTSGIAEGALEGAIATKRSPRLTVESGPRLIAR